ncbi:MAG: gliding motility protein GldC [Bacteroidetes bacterium]|nr:gliding motility protein GldC [Bacteroidota bacterium]
MKTSEIKFTVTMDENKLPIGIKWESSDSTEKGDCKSVMISLWDKNEENTLRIDLWTKDFLVDEMKQFFHQNLLSMAATFERATGEDKIMNDLRDYAAHFAEKMKLSVDKK